MDKEKRLDSKVQKEMKKYIEVNEESGKKSAIPTPQQDLPGKCVDGRDCYPENEPDDGKSYPTLGV